MADVPARLQPVAHNPAAFDAALSEADATIERLTTAMDDRRSRARALLASWEGAAASRFAGTWEPRLLAVHHDVLGEPRATRRNLCTALNAIEDENASRAQQRAAWQQERPRATGSSRPCRRCGPSPSFARTSSGMAAEVRSPVADLDAALGRVRATIYAGYRPFVLCDGADVHTGGAARSRSWTPGWATWPTCSPRWTTPRRCSRRCCRWSASRTSPSGTPGWRGCSA